MLSPERQLRRDLYNTAIHAYNAVIRANSDAQQQYIRQQAINYGVKPSRSLISNLQRMMFRLAFDERDKFHTRAMKKKIRNRLKSL